MTLEVKEWTTKDKGFMPLILTLATLQNSASDSGSPLYVEEKELWRYKDIRIAYELLKYDEQLAIQIANVIRTHTGK